MGVQSTSAAVQVLGSAGYTSDFPVEQYYRAARIHPIHEGTTGINKKSPPSFQISLKIGFMD
jgi:alkylation response protein AidB-like acyl-CoA dehydrogenase